MSGIRVLLVDDNPSARALLAAFMEQTEGLELVAAGGPMQMKEIYLSTAAAFHTTASCVEKNLRTVIRGMHGGASPLYLKVMDLNSLDRPPDNGTFLRRAAVALEEKSTER